MKLLIILRTLFCFAVILSSPLSWAACTIESGSMQTITIPLPATLSKPINTAPGKVVWDSGWISGSTIGKITCDNGGEYTMGYINSAYTKAAGFTDVFSTSVPGLGFRIYFCKNASCGTPPSGAYMGKAISGYSGSKTVFETNISAGPFLNVNTRYWLQLVATSGVLSNGSFNISSGTIASVTYSAAIIANLQVSGNTTVKGLGCQVNPDSTNITVFLPTIGVNNFSNTNPVPGDNSLARAFTVNLTCDQGVLASYQLDGTQAVTNVLANASGANMATGVGVQLYQGDTASTVVQPLATKTQANTVATGSNNQALVIPLTAKYYRTAANTNSIKGGRVSAIATLTLYYE